MPSDPNWFYSSLAQSAASIVGLIGAILATRRQQDIFDAGEKKILVEQLCKDFSRDFNKILTALRDYEKHSESQLNELEERINRGEKIFSAKLWYTPFETLRDQVDDSIERKLKIEQVYHKVAPILKTAFINLEQSDSVSALRVFEKELGKFHTTIHVEAEELEKIKNMMETVDSLRERAKKVLDENDSLKRRTHRKMEWFLILCLLGISFAGVIWPLFCLSKYNNSKGEIMLVVLSVCLLGLLWYILLHTIKLAKIHQVKPILKRE